MCGCSRALEPRRTRSVTSTFVSRNQPAIIAGTILPEAPPNTLTAIQAIDPERLRIERLRREAIRRSFGI